MSGEQQQASDYRVKYTREEFLKLVKIADPQIIYRVERIHFLSYDGFVMYTFECGDEDFIGKTIIQCVEFTNTPWEGMAWKNLLIVYLVLRWRFEKSSGSNNARSK